MTLYKQIYLFIVILFGVLFSGTLLLNFNSAKVFLDEQLRSHAQDTATSLGLSLSSSADTNDNAGMETMVNAIFDRGYYQEIAVERQDGSLAVQRLLDVEIEGVPQWFIRLIPLETLRANANVMNGWNVIGAVHVKSHPGYAHRELWYIATRMLVWFSLLAAIATILAGLILKRILRPLAAVERQAESLYAREYIIQENLPKTRELRNVVLTMNRMTEWIRATFEEQSQTAEALREQAFVDPVTGIANRREFDNLLQSHLKSTDDPQQGALLLIRLHVLVEINQTKGYEMGDELLRIVAQYLVESTSDSEATLVARLSGADFGVLLAGAHAQQAQQIADGICDELPQLCAADYSRAANIVNVGVALYAPHQTTTDILAQADAALRAAEAACPNSSSLRAQDTTLPAIGRQEWRNRLSDAITTKDVRLYVQSVVDASAPHKLLHAEVLVRIPADNEQLWHAGEFVPIAEQSGLAPELDRIVFLVALEQIKQRDDVATWAINISPASLKEETFRDWVVDTLRQAGTSPRISLEFSEIGVLRSVEPLRRLARDLQSLGHGLGLDHFGRGFSSFGYLQTVRPDYVKIDGAYTSSIRDDRNNQFFVSSLCKVVHSLGIKAIAGSVENEQEWKALRELKVDGIQGYAVERPVPITHWPGVNKAVAKKA